MTSILDNTETGERLFYGVVFASLLLHVVVFTVFVQFENRPAGEKPRIITVDMTTLPPPEPKPAAAVPAPQPVRPAARPPVAPPPTVVSRPAATPPVNAPPVPVAAIGEAAESRSASTKAEMAVPVAPPAAKRPVESAPAAPATSHTAKAPTGDSAEKLAKARASYRATIAALIDARKEYPLFSRKAGQQGTCTVRCTMMCDGGIKQVELVKSSGYDALDKAGLRAVNSVGKFPPPPHEGACTEVAFEVPITFRML